MKMVETPESRRSNLQKFLDLIRDQFEYGGKKYASTDHPTKEATDDLFDDFGKNWLFGTLAKYCKRYTNLARERDLLKIATYTYILWLKKGFQFDTSLCSAVIDTNVDMKSKYFDEYAKRLVSSIDFSQNTVKVEAKDLEEYHMEYMYDALVGLADLDWADIREHSFLDIAECCYFLWLANHAATAGSDTDTWNENKDGKSTNT